MRRAPTAAMDAGHRSPSSKTKGTPRAAPAAHPATAVKNWGDVAAIRSGFSCHRAAAKPVTMKLRKSRVRRTTPLLEAMKVLTRTTRIPDMSSVRYHRFRWPGKTLPWGKLGAQVITVTAWPHLTQ